MTELWRWVVGSDTHEVSSLGRVRGLVVGKRRYDAPVLVRPHYSAEYLQVYVRVDGRRVPRYVHRLVLDAFVGIAPAGHHACHFPDADAPNCRLSNLRWDTPAGNGLDKRALNAGAEAIAARIAALQQVHPHLAAQVAHRTANGRSWLRPARDLDFYTSRKAVA